MNRYEELIKKRKDETLPWRGDAELTFSDWTIRVIQTSNEDISTRSLRGNGHDEINNMNNYNTSRTNTNSKLENVYHVHRVNLSFGPMKSEYFETQFSLQYNTQESLSKTTTLELPETACMAFPLLLDYVYDRNSDTSTLSETDRELMNIAISRFLDDGTTDIIREATGFVFLADYLRVPNLLDLAWKRIDFLLECQQTAPIICREGLSFGIEPMVEKCIKIAAKHSKYLSLDPPKTSGAQDNFEPWNSVKFDGPKEKPWLGVHFTQKILEMLSHKQQIQLLRLSLSEATKKEQNIRVSNAGTAEVDGLYKSDGQELGGTKYSRLGSYKGEQCKFSLFKCLCTSATQMWFISVLDNEQPGTDWDIDFYRARVIAGCDKIPPLFGWEVCGEGRPAPPTFTFEKDSDD